MQPLVAPKTVFDQTISLIHAGDLGRAEARCRAALERYPRDVNMRALLGALLVKMERPGEAEALLREAIAAAPTFAKPHEDLGFLLLQAGRPADALPLLERATRLDPSLERAWFSLGKALALLGRGADSDAAFERSFSLSPERRLMALAAEHQREGRQEEAERLYRRVLRENPRQVDALRLLALIAARTDHADEAEMLLERALAIAPGFQTALLDLGRLRKEQDRFSEALDCFDRAIALDPSQPQGHFLRASTLARASFTHEAIDGYRACLERRPAHVGALLGLGHVLKAVGDYEGAVASYDACIRHAPGSGETYWSLANLKTYRFDDESIAAMEQRASEPGGDSTSAVNFLFALGKAHEDRGDFERAWRFYRGGNEKQRAEVAYDPVQTEVMNDRLVDVYSAEFLAARAAAGNPDPAPIFIVGLPRSGSTLLEQVLASHSQIEGTGELPYIGRIASSLNRNRADGLNYPEAMRELAPANLRALADEYLASAQMHRRTGAARFIDKMPNNFPNAGFIATILPNAKIIDARRHPLDACLSCYRQLFAKGQNFTYDLTEIGEYYLQYQRLMDHWSAVMPGRVLTVQYEEVVGDFEAQARRLLDFCGLAWEDACLRFYESDRPVRTPSAEQVRQPIYDRSVGHWLNYERHLGELVAVIAPIRERYRRYEPEARDAVRAGEDARPGRVPGGT
ncbi:MAG: tetratricopeptide repeat-containing sulfotransferase family protein [Steroidobacteraceae bacterium]